MLWSKKSVSAWLERAVFKILSVSACQKCVVFKMASFSMAGMCPGQNYQFQHGWNMTNMCCRQKCPMSGMCIGLKSQFQPGKFVSLSQNGGPTFAHTTFAQGHLPRDICPEQYLPRRRLPRQEPLKPRTAVKTQTCIGLSWTWAC
jgi:hypothetical protein